MRRLPAALRGDSLPTLDTFKGLTPDQREAHRANIGVRVEAILSQFWRNDETPDAVAALELEGWMDVLEYTTPHEIRMAWAKYQREGPRSKSGALYRPDAGALHAIIIAMRREERAKREGPPVAQETEQRGPRVTANEAQAILKKNGFGHIVKRFGGRK